MNIVSHTRCCLRLLEVLLPRRPQILLLTSKNVWIFHCHQRSFVGGVTNADVVGFWRRKLGFWRVDFDVAVRIHWELGVVLSSTEVQAEGSCVSEFVDHESCWEIDDFVGHRLDGDLLFNVQGEGDVVEFVSGLIWLGDLNWTLEGNSQRKHGVLFSLDNYEDGVACVESLCIVGKLILDRHVHVLSFEGFTSGIVLCSKHRYRPWNLHKMDVNSHNILG